MNVPEHLRSRPESPAISSKQKRARTAPPPRIDWQEQLIIPGTEIVPRCVLLGDSKLVCHWLNGEWTIKHRQYERLVALTWQTCCEWIQREVCFPACSWSNFGTHIYREYNSEADRAANKHCWDFQTTMALELACVTAKLFKAHFDGSYYRDGQACAGIVLYYSLADARDFKRLCEISVPLSVDSACQA